MPAAISANFATWRCPRPTALEASCIATLAASSTSVLTQRMFGIVRWHQPTLVCMRIEYADRNSDEQRGDDGHEDPQADARGRGLDRADVAGLLAVLPGLRRQAARDREPDGDADEQRDDDRGVAQ